MTGVWRHMSTHDRKRNTVYCLCHVWQSFNLKWLRSDRTNYTSSFYSPLDLSSQLTSNSVARLHSSKVTPESFRYALLYLTCFQLNFIRSRIINIIPFSASLSNSFVVYLFVAIWLPNLNIWCFKFSYRCFGFGRETAGSACGWR